jgi:tRNA pseudouridine65 synthase
MVDAAEALPTPLPVLFVDDHVVAVSKPSGLLVHRDGNHPDAPAALQTVRDQLGRFLYPVQRLDRGTSGILVFAFASATAAALQAALGEDGAVKEYLALVRWPGARRLGPRWCNEQPLADDKAIARAACTEFDLVEALPRCALVRCRIRSGRYHQIRRHLEHDGRRILGDTTYGKRSDNAWFARRHGLERMFLHMGRLSVRHPVTGVQLDLVDELPLALQSVLASLRARLSGPKSCPTARPTSR